VCLFTVRQSLPASIPISANQSASAIALRPLVCSNPSAKNRAWPPESPPLLQSGGVRSTPSVWSFFGTYLRPQWARMLVLGGLVLAAIVLDLANPQILRVFIDTATQTTELDRLLTIGLIFLAVAVAAQVIAIAETYVAEN